MKSFVSIDDSCHKLKSTLLGRAHRFCVKYIQNLPVYTKTDVYIGLAGVSPIGSDIDYRKLLFLGQICRAPSLRACKKLFNYRLFSFFISGNSLKLGFIPDIVRILRKYSLEDYLQRYMATGLFPTKVQWKRISRNFINGQANTTWLTRNQTDSHLSSFLYIKPQVLFHSELWELSRSISSRVIAKHCNNCVKMIAKFYSDSFTKFCHYCKNHFSVSLCVHVVLQCPSTESLRIELFHCISMETNECTYQRFRSLSNNDVVVALFSGLRNILENNVINHRLLLVIIPILGKFWIFFFVL